MKEIRSAIIGCGTIFPWHAESLKDIEGTKLVAVVDVVEERAQKAGKEYGAAVYTDYRQVLERDDVDVIHICTPSGIHGKMGLDAISAGKHVLIEKPIEIKLDLIHELIQAAHKRGVKLGGIFQRRFHASTIRLKEAKDNERFGKLALADLNNKNMRTQAYYNQDAWRGTWALDGGGALMNQGIHGVDLIQYVMGPVKRLSALTKTLVRDIEVEDTAVALLEFSSGALGVIKATTSIYPGYRLGLSVHGDQGSAEVLDEKITEWNFQNKLPHDEGVVISKEVDNLRGSDPKAHGYGAHTENIKDFFDAVREDRQPMVSGEEAARAVEIILAIYESSRTGKWVDLTFDK